MKIDILSVKDGAFQNADIAGSSSDGLRQEFSKNI